MGFQTTAPWDGMLFTFGADLSTDAFYMKDTLIPLDIAFIGRDGTVQDLLSMEPCPPTVSECPLYRASMPYASALEVEKGKAAMFGISPGAHVAIAGSC
jgi:uncharacterized protein